MLWHAVDTIKLVRQMAYRMDRLGVSLGGFLPSKNLWCAKGATVFGSFGFVLGTCMVFSAKLDFSIQAGFFAEVLHGRKEMETKKCQAD